VDIISAALLGVVQGLTEFLPVSSSGHLILARAFFGWDPGRYGIAFDVACHVGTLLAVVAFFRADIVKLVAAAPGALTGRDGEYERFGRLIIAGTIPIVIVGGLFAEVIETRLRSPLVVAVTCAHLFTVLAMKRSVLTEKVARRGFHVTREYAIDPLEVLFVHEVMRTEPLLEAANGAVAYADETLRTVAHRMAETGHLELEVLERESSTRIGVVALADLLKARSKHLEEETRRETVLDLPLPTNWIGKTIGLGR